MDIVQFHRNRAWPDDVLDYAVEQNEDLTAMAKGKRDEK
jgi:hypothetical protein